MKKKLFIVLPLLAVVVTGTMLFLAKSKQKQATVAQPAEVKTEVIKTEATKEETKTETTATTATPASTTSNTVAQPSTPPTVNQAPAPTVTTTTQNGATITTKTETIPYKTIDKYASTNAKSRVFQQGVNGTKVITYTNGTKTSEKITAQPKDHIIERYVEVSPRKVTKQEVEDKNQPVYKYIVKERWFVRNRKTGQIFIYYTIKEAMDKHNELGGNRIPSNWGTYESEKVYTNEVKYYNTVEKEIVQEAKYEWKH